MFRRPCLYVITGGSCPVCHSVHQLCCLLINSLVPSFLLFPSPGERVRIVKIAHKGPLDVTEAHTTIQFNQNGLDLGL